MAATDTSTSTAKLGGARRLTLLDTIAQSIGFMGPVFSIAFLVPLLVGLNASGNGAGSAAPLSVLIAAVGVFALGWIVAQYAKRIHAAGSLYDYVTDGLGTKVGAAAGGLYYAGILSLAAGIDVLISGTIHDTLMGEFQVEPLPTWGWDIVLLVLISVVLYFGVALSTRTQLILAMISLTVVLAFFIFVIGKVGSGNDVATALKPSSSPQGFTGVMFGVLYGVLLFTGFETSANLAEETEHPKRDIPRAVLFSILLIAGFYLIGAYAQVAGYHFSMKAIGDNVAAPLFGLAGPHSGGGYGSVALRRIVEFVVILDMLAVLIGCSTAASRGFFAMARDGRLPRPLARIGSRGTPVGASVFVVGAFVVTVLVTHLWTGLVALPQTPHYAAIFTWGSTFGSFALAVIYLLMAVGAIVSLRGDGVARGKVLLAGVVGIVVTGAAIFGTVYKVTSPTIYAPWIAGAVFAIGLVLAFLKPERAQTTETSFAGLAPADQGPVKI